MKKNTIIFVDGASRGNPGPAGAGIFGYHSTPETPLLSFGCFLGKQTNNVAEYTALALALHLAAQNPLIASSTLYADSELMVKQVNGIYRVKNSTLLKWYHLIQHLKQQKPFTLQHVRREKNKYADALANKGIDTKQPIPESFRQLLQHASLSHT